VVSGAVAPHSNPATFQGCRAATIAEALRAELTDDDTYIHVSTNPDGLVVTILEGQAGARNYQPVLAVTLVERADTLSVSVGALSQASKREVISSLSQVLLDGGRHLLMGRRGVGGLINTAGRLVNGVGNLIEEVQDLNMPKRVWAIVDRVGLAAEKVYLEEQRQAREAERQRQAALRAWTHCSYCGRAYEDAEQSQMRCPSCGGPRGSKPAWLS
ncbi:MAG: hypothetical protein GX601_19400, partial [Anaerolineales bacterium]|nr:hypothetical protein [Anaerolineales bacterium]